MLKLRVSLALALLASGITVLFGILQDARLVTLCYRALVSFVIFGLVGLLAGKLLEKMLYEFADKQTIGKNIDVSTAEEMIPDFSPFTPDMVERVKRPD